MVGDYGQILGGGGGIQQPAQVTAPNMAMPGGQSEPDDPYTFEAATTVDLLKKLASLYTQSGDEQSGNEVDAMANKLNRIKFKRRKSLQDAYREVQKVTLPAMM